MSTWKAAMQEALFWAAASDDTIWRYKVIGRRQDNGSWRYFVVRERCRG